MSTLLLSAVKHGQILDAVGVAVLCLCVVSLSFMALKDKEKYEHMGGFAIALAIISGATFLTMAVNKQQSYV